MSSSITISNPIANLTYMIFCIATAMIGYQIHHNWLYTFFNFLYAPIAWIYWLITHHVTWKIIEQTFAFFFN